MSITTQTRFESYEKLDVKFLYGKIVNLLLAKDSTEGLTAREIAIELYNDGIIKDNSRQATQPRLTELVDKGIVQVVGKKYDKLTERKVASYRLSSLCI